MQFNIFLNRIETYIDDLYYHFNYIIILIIVQTNKYFCLLINMFLQTLCQNNSKLSLKNPL